MAGSKKRFLGVLIAASIAVSLCAAEILLGVHRFAPGFSQPGNASDYRVLLDRNILFRIKPFSGREINNYGYRDRDFHIRKSGRKRILFYGDSFVSAFNVRTDQTMPKVLEALSGGSFEVYNMGVPSYGPDQSLLQLQKEGLSFKPDIVILTIYPANDFNDLLYNRLFFRNRKGELIYNKANPVSTAIPRLDILYLYQYGVARLAPQRAKFLSVFRQLFGEPYDGDLMENAESEISTSKRELMQVILREFRKTASSNNIDLLVVIMPSWANIVEHEVFREKFDITDSAKYFVNEDTALDICKRESIRTVNLYPLFLRNKAAAELFDLEDRHLSVSGYRFAAEIIYRHLAGAVVR